MALTHQSIRAATRCAAAALTCLIFGAVNAGAQQIDLSLNLFYNVPTDPLAGGTWEVVAKSDGQGIQGLTFALEDISAGVSLHLPAGLSNGSLTQNAGFDFASVAFFAGADRHEFAAFQFPSAGPEADAFYGFGTISNGSPAFADTPAGATTLGPTYNTLTQVTNLPWSSTADVFGDAAWDNAALVASGSFGVGDEPAFTDPSGEILDGSVWTSIGSTSSVGTFSGAIDGATTVTTTTRSGAVSVLPDFNMDDVVDALDYAIWRESLGDNVAPFTEADASGNGVVDEADFLIWKDNYGATAAPGAGASATPTPSPSGAVLTALLMTTAGLFRRQKTGVFSTQANFPKNRQYREKLLDTQEGHSHNAAS